MDRHSQAQTSLDMSNVQADQYGLRNRRRERYSMNYKGYESGRVDPKEENARMLEYTFRGYKTRPNRYQRDNLAQTDLSFDATLSEDEQNKLLKEFDYKEYVEPVEVDTAVEELTEYMLKKKQRGSLAPHGWVGPPLVVKLQVKEFLFIEVTPVARPPVLLRLNKNLIRHTLEIAIVPGPQFVPQVIIKISGLEVYPNNKYKLSSINKTLSVRPTVYINSNRGLMVKSGGEWKTRGDTEDTMDFRKTYRFDEAICKDFAGMMKEHAPRRKHIKPPESWHEMRLSDIINPKQYRLNHYSDLDLFKENEIQADNALSVILERDHEPNYKFNSPKQMKTKDEPIQYSKQFLRRSTVKESPSSKLDELYLLFERPSDIEKLPIAEEKEESFALEPLRYSSTFNVRAIDALKNPQLRSRRGTFYPVAGRSMEIKLPEKISAPRRKSRQLESEKIEVVSSIQFTPTPEMKLRQDVPSKIKTFEEDVQSNKSTQPEYKSTESTSLMNIVRRSKGSSEPNKRNSIETKRISGRSFLYETEPDKRASDIRKSIDEKRKSQDTERRKSSSHEKASLDERKSQDIKQETTTSFYRMEVPIKGSTESGSLRDSSATRRNTRLKSIADHPLIAPTAGHSPSPATSSTRKKSTDTFKGSSKSTYDSTSHPLFVEGVQRRPTVVSIKEEPTVLSATALRTVLEEQLKKEQLEKEANEYARARINRYRRARGASPVSPSPSPKTLSPKSSSPFIANKARLTKSKSSIKPATPSKGTPNVKSKYRNFNSGHNMRLYSGDKALEEELKFFEFVHPKYEASETLIYEKPVKDQNKFSKKIMPERLPTIAEESPQIKAPESPKSKHSLYDLVFRVRREFTPFLEKMEILKEKMEMIKAFKENDDVPSVAPDRQSRHSRLEFSFEKISRSTESSRDGSKKSHRE